MKESPRRGRQPFIMSKSHVLRCRTLRALGFLTSRYPGVPVRSTPGFMLPPAAWAQKKEYPHDFLRASGSLTPCLYFTTVTLAFVVGEPFSPNQATPS